ncbi:MAG: hypothetical protein QOH57_1100, partial [Mycobacterium sp.]|nr:hypothetical protein [Mycobacterium sp.]
QLVEHAIGESRDEPVQVGEVDFVVHI